MAKRRATQLAKEMVENDAELSFSGAGPAIPRLYFPKAISFEFLTQRKENSLIWRDATQTWT